MEAGEDRKSKFWGGVSGLNVECKMRCNQEPKGQGISCRRLWPPGPCLQWLASLPPVLRAHTLEVS